MNTTKRLILVWCIGTIAALPGLCRDSVAIVTNNEPVANVTTTQTTTTTTTATKPSGSWTLQQCVDWAKEQNITVQRKRVNVRTAELDVHTAKQNRLPTVSFSSSQMYNNRPFAQSSASVVGSEVVYNSYKNTYTGSYGLNASMTLYDGNQMKNNIKLKELAQQIAELDVDASELSIEESITQLYVNILYIEEAIKYDKELIDLSKQQLERAKALHQAGLLNKVDVSQFESQTAADEYQLVTDQTTLENYKLQLRQLLELDGDESFSVSDPDFEDDVLAPLPAKDDVYAAALAQRPEIKSKLLAMQQYDINEDIAKAGHRPTVTANAGITTSNSSGNGNMFTQLKDQINNGIGLTISIPIWDHGKTKDAVEKVRLQRESAYLDLLDTEKTLWKSIETYWLNAHSNQQRYISAKSKYDYARQSYDLTSEQFRLGLKNIVELTTDKTNVSSAAQQMLQAKYMALYNLAMLRFYKGQNVIL